MQTGSHLIPLEKTGNEGRKAQGVQVIHSKPQSERWWLLLAFCTLTLERSAELLSYLLASICHMQSNSR